MRGQILVSSNSGGMRYEFLSDFSGTCTVGHPPVEDLMFAKALDDKEEDQSGGRSPQKPFPDVGGCLTVFPAKFI